MEMNKEEKAGETATSVFICRNKIELALISRTPTDLPRNSCLIERYTGLSERELYKHTHKKYNDNMTHPYRLLLFLGCGDKYQKGIYYFLNLACKAAESLP